MGRRYEICTYRYAGPKGPYGIPEFRHGVRTVAGVNNFRKARRIANALERRGDKVFVVRQCDGAEWEQGHWV